MRQRDVGWIGRRIGIEKKLVCKDGDREFGCMTMPVLRLQMRRS